MNRNDLIAIRDRLPGDEAFILSTWLKGLLYGGNDFYRMIPKEIYYSNHHKLIEKLLAFPATSVKVACLKDDPEVIIAYVVYREGGGQTVIDWTHCKKAWRGIGIARSLWPKNVYAVSNLTKAGKAIIDKSKSVIFNPYV